MKRILCFVFSIIFLCGCSKDTSANDYGMQLRKLLLQADGCVFDAVITVDYGEDIYSFKMNCQWKSDGSLDFTVIEPNTIEGITGNISNQGGQITFDNNALFFEIIADGHISPISAPWVMFRALTGGYIKGSGRNDNGYIIQIDDSYEENALNLNLQLDGNRTPSFAEFFWQGRRVVSIELENFRIL